MIILNGIQRIRLSPVASNLKAEGSASKSNLAIASTFVARSGISNSTQKYFFSFTGDSNWIIDSGASNNMTCDHYVFSDLSPGCSKSVITNANGVFSSC